MFKKTKGEYGYITKTKKYDIIKMLIYMAIALAVFVTGLLLNKMSYSNVFTVVSILFVLPWAKVLVEFIVMFPYKTPEKEDYKQVETVLPEDSRLLSDLVITSEEKSMGLNFMVIGSGFVHALVMNDKQNVDYIQNYLRTGVANWSSAYQVKIHKNKESFLKGIKEVKKKEISAEEIQQVEEYLLSLIV